VVLDFFLIFLLLRSPCKNLKHYDKCLPHRAVPHRAVQGLPSTRERRQRDFLPGPEKYRERGNGVPRKADSWQEGRSLYHEEPGIWVVIYALEGEKVGKLVIYGSICTLTTVINVINISN
jgi:hypothetical protein